MRWTEEGNADRKGNFHKKNKPKQAGAMMESGYMLFFGVMAFTSIWISIFLLRKVSMQWSWFLCCGFVFLTTSGFLEWFGHFLRSKGWLPDCLQYSGDLILVDFLQVASDILWLVGWLASLVGFALLASWARETQPIACNIRPKDGSGKSLPR